MKKQFSNITVAAAGAVLLLSACNNSPYPGYDQAENGVYAKFYNQDEAGVKPKENDVVRVTMLYKNSKDSVIFDSKKTPSGQTYIEFPLGKSTFKGSFEDALSLMSVGDSASFKISADSVYLKTFMMKELPAYIEKGSMLTFEAKLDKITSKEEVEKEQKKKMEEQQVMMELRKNEEPKILAKYLEDNKITTKPTASGLYFIEKTKGKGPKPTMGSVVKVNYVGTFLDGTIFDTNVEEKAKAAGVYDQRRPYEPADFTIGQLIPGMNEGLMMMSEGGKATIIVPSTIGYGEGGQGMPPYSTLAFEVEVLKVSPASESNLQPGVNIQQH